MRVSRLSLLFCRLTPLYLTPRGWRTGSSRLTPRACKRQTSVGDLARHLDHCRPETRGREQPLRGLVALRSRENDARCTASGKLGDRCVEQRAPDAAATSPGIDDDVVEHARRAAQ